jgi:hypothetical protein
MTIQEMVTYLADLASLIRFHEGLGQSTPNKWVVAEFMEVNESLLQALRDKHAKDPE